MILGPSTKSVNTTILSRVMCDLRWTYIAVVLLAAFILTACSGSPDAPDLTPDIDWDVVARLEQEVPQVSWRKDVQPVLESRCIVCHGCYDAPCQFKLTSYEGLIRGANPAKVYDGTRFKAAQPTRLFIDANSEEEWRNKGFHSVLKSSAEVAETNPPQRLRDSVLYRILRLKQLNPQPRTGLVSEHLTLSLDRKQTCTLQKDFAKFEHDHPLWGMPYALPNLSDGEYQILVKWLAAGTQEPEPVNPSDTVAPQIERWEKFLNGTSKRERLVSRYVYEHLFLGHLHFEGGPEREFYRLVRSYTPPGEAIHEIPTVRPFNDPGAAQFWYRLRRYDASIVAKSHVVYTLSNQKMDRYKELFFDPDYSVEKLPGYDLPAAANPFISFGVIPAKSRYEFMLDDARFFIQGFIKGPVCRGQVALNVIEDQFWVFFLSPKSLESKDTREVLASVSDYLQVPSSTETLNLLASYGEYWDSQKKYLAVRNQYFAEQVEKKGDAAFSGIWDGGGTNPNAALTIFRNFDSAAVEFGLLGYYPKTAWIIDFPLFERIHYLLVAGFDVYGNVGHQLNSRLFMDFLRMEGEDNFLTYLPAANRKQIRDSWYQGIREKRSKYFQEPMEWNSIESPLDYKTDNPQRELYDRAIQYLGDLVSPKDYLNRCEANDCVSDGATETIRVADTILRRFEKRNSKTLQNSPDLVYLRVVVKGAPDIPYTLIVNKSYQNLTSLLDDGNSQSRAPENDTMTLLRGISGSYPNFFLVVPFEELSQFVDAAMSSISIESYQLFVAKYGIRRTNDNFWEHSDWFQKQYAELEPVESGILDLNRYGNH